MEFKKINDKRFQCRLDEEDLEDNNISLDDFFKNDTEKIHSLLEVIMEEAERSIGVSLSGEIMSLQLAPQPDHSILLTVSSGKEDLGNMLRKAGETLSKALSKPEKSNVLKNGEGAYSDASFETFGDSADKTAVSEEKADGLKENDEKKAQDSVFRLRSFSDFEEMCAVSPKTWGISNALYKCEAENTYYLVLQRGRGSQEKYLGLLNLLVEYGYFDSARPERAAYIKEHYREVISSNAINVVKKYM